MKRTTIVIIAAIFCGTSAQGFAQTTTTESKTPAVATPETKNANAPLDGKNSFTEAQAQDRIAKAGYTNVSSLKLDDKGIWRGTATKDGKSTPVGLDYQGHIFAQ